MKEHEIEQEKELAENLRETVEEEPAAAVAEPEREDPLRILAEENGKVRDQLLRLAAEFDNYRKRNEREIGQVIRNANSDLVASLLPVLDDLERILAAPAPAPESATYQEAVRLVYKSFVKTLQDTGLSVMHALNQPFDPEKHDALLHLPVEGQESNRVVEEHKKGYEFHGRVIRHAQVIVSK